MLDYVKKAIKGKTAFSVFPVEQQKLAVNWIYSLLRKSNLQKNNCGTQ